MRLIRVLVVDDNELNVELLSFVLTEDAFELQSAAYAQDALLAVANFHPDLILMDMHLPGMDGLALTRLLKADPALRHIVIVAFTASAMKGDQARMLEAGCDGYLSKPIDVDTFAASVLAFLPGAVLTAVA